MPCPREGTQRKGHLDSRQSHQIQYIPSTAGDAQEERPRCSSFGERCKSFYLEFISDNQSVTVQKIADKELEIKQQERQKQLLEKTSARIKNKLEKLSVFAKFLEKVREDNQDDFNELYAIVGRFETLETEN